MASSPEQIAIAKVAALINEHTIALNAGGGAGIEVGDVVTLHDVIPVSDPDTGEPLGRVLMPRVRLAVNSVQEKLSTAAVTDRIRKPLSSGAEVGAIVRRKLVLDQEIVGWQYASLKIGERAIVTRVINEDEAPF